MSQNWADYYKAYYAQQGQQQQAAAAQQQVAPQQGVAQQAAAQQQAILAQQVAAQQAAAQQQAAATQYAAAAQQAAAQQAAAQQAAAQQAVPQQPAWGLHPVPSAAGLAPSQYPAASYSSVAMQPGFQQPAQRPVQQQVQPAYQDKSYLSELESSKSRLTNLVFRAIILAFILIFLIVLVILIIAGIDIFQTRGHAVAQLKEEQPDYDDFDKENDNDRSPMKYLERPKLDKNEARKQRREGSNPTTKRGNQKSLTHLPSHDEEEEVDSGASINPQGTIQCGPVKFGYCSPSVEAFYYERATSTCESSGASPVSRHICNRSPNRFATREGCQRACVTKQVPFTRCRIDPFFVECDRKDVKHSWWYKEHKRCVEWPFPQGACPFKAHSNITKTKEECEYECLGDRTDVEMCTRPAPLPCSTTDLKFPYFAFKFADQDKLVCLAAYSEEMSNNRCLVGANKFETKEKCEATCGLLTGSRPPLD